MFGEQKPTPYWIPMEYLVGCLPPPPKRLALATTAWTEVLGFDAVYLMIGVEKPDTDRIDHMP